MDQYVLLLSRKVVSLLKVSDTQLKEVHDGIFPIDFKDDYEYSKPSRGNSFGNSLKSFEKDKSISKKQRFTHFLSEVNKNLKNYLSSNSTLMLVGTDQDRAIFKGVSDYIHLITGELAGSYSTSRLSQLKQALSNITIT